LLKTQSKNKTLTSLHLYFHCSLLLNFVDIDIFTCRFHLTFHYLFLTFFILILKLSIPGPWTNLLLQLSLRPVGWLLRIGIAPDQKSTWVWIFISKSTVNEIWSRTMRFTTLCISTPPYWYSNKSNNLSNIIDEKCCQVKIISYAISIIEIFNEKNVF